MNNKRKQETEFNYVPDSKELPIQGISGSERLSIFADIDIAVDVSLTIPYLPRQHLGDLIWANAKSSSSLLIVRSCPFQCPSILRSSKALRYQISTTMSFG